MEAVQREDCDGLAHLLIKAGHLFNFLWVWQKAAVHLLLAIVDIADHQHHELHGSSPPFVCLSCTLGRVAAPEFDTRPKYVCSRRRSALVVLVVAVPPDG